ncbi:pilus (MSHA type) biogenesis protein MshL [Zoogloeaceae bacteirum Par-f-2]|nr:pilus (MSHA type) biogenesis protein MshL [Zoogloeaceae bacteirum Par-f-2]
MKSCPLHATLAAVALILSACAAPRPIHDPGSPASQLREEIAARSQAPTSAALPPEVAAALLPPLPAELPKAPERRFDIDVRDVDARSFFVSLLHDTGANIVVHPAVSGTLSLSLRNVTVAEVMDAVRDVYGYDIRRNRAGWQVFPAALQSRLFNVNYINLNRDGRSETRVSSGQLRANDQNGTAASSGQESPNPASSQIETTSRSRFWTELEQSLRLIVGLDGASPPDPAAATPTAADPTAGAAPVSAALPAGRAVMVNPHTGLVLVRGMPAELREVESFLASLQDTVTRQVLIEAKILEVVLADGYQTGINWAGLQAGKDGSILIGQGPGYSGSSQPANNSLLGMLDSTGAFSPFQPGSGLDANAFGGIFSVALQARDFGAFIELLKTQGDVQVLSSPRIATMNNQKAVIKVGSDEFFVTGISSTNTTTGTTTTVTPDIELTPFFSGIALDVTPQIDPNGDVLLHIRPAVTEVVDQTKTLTVFGQTQTLPLAFSTMREADSIVRAKNGQIIVIGGLMQDTQRDDRASVPLLGDLPVLGDLFRHTKKSRRKTELVILLKPIVVDNGQIWQGDLAGTAQRLDTLRTLGDLLQR